MKNIFVGIAVSACLFINLNQTQASELGLYFGDGVMLDYSSHSIGKTGATFNMHWTTKDTGDTYLGQQISFKSYGLGAGFSGAGLMDNLVVMGAIGYGLSMVAVDNTNLASTTSSTGLYYQIGANYQVTQKWPVTVGVKLLSVPSFDWTTSTGPKTYGGTSFWFGASLAF